MLEKLISVITPFYQSEKYLKTAIESVLNQSHQNWELMLINDGSTDQSKLIAQSFQDSRIKYFEQENGGVAAARNLGLEEMEGDFFCFLDADDVLPPQSLEARLKVFEKSPKIEFVDGVVNRMDESLTKLNEIWTPNFQGNPFSDLLKLTGKSFFGPSWMIKRKPNFYYQLQDGLTHCEDLYFYMQLSREGGIYDFTDVVVLQYRDNPNSAMKNLKGLELGYRFMASQIKDWPEVSSANFNSFRFKYKKAMSLAYIRTGNFLNAFSCLI